MNIRIRKNFLEIFFNIQKALVIVFPKYKLNKPFKLVPSVYSFDRNHLEPQNT